MNAVVKRLWTEDEVLQLKNLISGGHCREEIAQILGRTPVSVQQKAFWLNLLPRHHKESQLS
jgi:hypothetical protein